MYVRRTYDNDPECRMKIVFLVEMGQIATKPKIKCTQISFHTGCILTNVIVKNRIFAVFWHVFVPPAKKQM